MTKKIDSFKKKKHTKIKIVSSILAACLVIALLGYGIYFSNKIYPGVYIANIYVGGNTKEEALRKISNEVKIPEKINIKVKDRNFELSLNDISFSYDFNGTVDYAYKYGKGYNFVNNLYDSIKLYKDQKRVPFIISFDSQRLDEYLAVVASQITQKPIAPSAKIVAGKIIVQKGQPGETLDTESFSDTLIGKLSSHDFSDTNLHIISEDKSLTEAEAENLKNRSETLVGKNLNLENEFDTIVVKDSELVTFLNGKGGYNREIIIEHIEKMVAPKVNRDPQNAVFRMEDNVVKEFIPAKNGLTVDKDVLEEKIEETLSSLEKETEKTAKLEVPVVATTPKVTTSEVNNLGIKELIGRGSSRFPGSIANRIYNVGHASSKFKSVIVPPGETLSFNGVLGDVSSLTGYKQAYVIKDGRTVLGDGGGVCQVSTTLFRAALNAGLPITERHAHSYRVSYYESDSKPGLDATVFAPTSDLKIVNDTPGHILIQSIFNRENLSLIFEIYGTSDGREVTVTTPKITSQSAPPPDLYVDDPNLPAGTIKQIEHKAWGAKTSFDYKVVRNGETLIEKTFYSNYRPWQAVYLKGTGPAM